MKKRIFSMFLFLGCLAMLLCACEGERLFSFRSRPFEARLRYTQSGQETQLLLRVEGAQSRMTVLAPEVLAGAVFTWDGDGARGEYRGLSHTFPGGLAGLYRVVRLFRLPEVTPVQEGEEYLFSDGDTVWRVRLRDGRPATVSLTDQDGTLCAEIEEFRFLDGEVQP